jgi:RNA polymerase sigma-70 factor (ECF subfamily)
LVLKPADAMKPDLKAADIQDVLARFQAGDDDALDELIRRTGDRLERLAHNMLLSFPSVRALEQTGDVLQSALVRLTRSLRQIRPPTPADFFRLAAAQIRRELLDLVRFHRRRAPADGQSTPLTIDPPDHNAANDADLDRWHALHEAVERLPTDLRETFSLTYYHGWTQTEIASLFQISDRQVRRLWRDACARLSEMVGGSLPGM